MKYKLPAKDDIIVFLYVLVIVALLIVAMISASDSIKYRYADPSYHRKKQ